MTELERWLPHHQSTFLVTTSLEEIHRKLETVKKEIGEGSIRKSEFFFTRVLRPSANNVYRIIGKIEPEGTGYRISYYIRRLHRIIQVLYVVGIPLNFGMFFIHEEYRLGIPSEYPLVIYALIVLFAIGVVNWMFNHLMSRSDQVIRKAFG